jgi:hypothetical protein
MDEQTLALIYAYQDIIRQQEEYIAGVELFLDILLYCFLFYTFLNLLFDEWDSIRTYTKRHICRRNKDK